MREAQVSFLDFLLATLLSIGLLISIYSFSFSIYNKWLRDEIKTELKFISLKVSNEIIKAYGIARESSYIPENFSSFLIYEKELDLPFSIKGRDYEIYLTNPNLIWISILNISSQEEINAKIETGGIKVIGKTTQDPKVEVQLNFPNLDVIVGGKTNGKSNFKYYRVNFNGNIVEFAIIGNYNILGKITNIR